MVQENCLKIFYMLSRFRIELIFSAGITGSLMFHIMYISQFRLNEGSIRSMNHV